VFFCRTDAAGGWLADFDRTPTADGGVIGGTDHVALAQPYDHFDEAALFYRAVLGMDPEPTSEIAAPFGLVRDRTVTAGGVRLVLTASLLRRGEWAPGISDPQYIAFAAPDALAVLHGDAEELGDDRHDRRRGDLRRGRVGDQVAQHNLGQLRVDRLPVERRERRDPAQGFLILVAAAIYTQARMRSRTAT